MEITISSIISLFTLLIGYLSKYLGLNSKYIPLQNIIIGLTSGIVAYLLGLNNNLLNSIIFCLISSLSAGGLYDSLKRGENIEN